MNWHKQHKELKTLLLRPEKRKSSNPSKPDKQQFYKGVYVISRDLDENKNKELQYKIGMAHGYGGLFERLKDYEICYPYSDEYFIHFLILTHTGADAKKLEKVILHSASLSIVKRPKDTLKDTEYRTVLKKETLHNCLLKALKNNTDMWSYIAVMGDKGWKLIKNCGDDNINSGLLSKPPNSKAKKVLPFSTDDKCYVEKERIDAYKDTGEIYNKTLKANFDINTAKKGHEISDQYTNDGTIQKVSKKGVKGVNPNPYIMVTSPDFPEDDPKGYKLWIQEPR